MYLIFEHVGIGTTSPGAKLSFGTFLGAPLIYLNDGGAGLRTGLGIHANETQFYNAANSH
jgi:hypothetical protein